MKEMETFRVIVIDEYNDIFNLSFTKHQYSSLRNLIADNYPEEFGECKGRGLCGTCHVKLINGSLKETIEADENKTLRTIYDTDTRSRLACKIILDEKINNMTFKIINDN